ncbi:MAG: bacteriohemerythrin [Terracidiphilus sp.]|jgi:hemerythrin-like metal-binding protein
MYEWKNEYSVGVQAFDNAHKQLFTCFDEFYAAVKEGNAQEKVGLILDKTLAYTKQHFESEEKWLAGKKDPDLVPHREQHRKFQAQIEDLIQQHRAGKIALSGSVSKALREWLSGHIMQIDQHYAARYKALGTIAS